MTTNDNSNDNISPKAAAIVAHLKDGNGQFRIVRFKSTKTPAAKFKGTVLEKETEMTVRTGVAFANLKSVKEAIANGEREEVGSLPDWQEWLVYPFILRHKGNGTEYVRLTTCPNTKGRTIYRVNNEVVEKSVFDSFLTPSEAKGSDKPLEIISIKLENLISIG